MTIWKLHDILIGYFIGAIMRRTVRKVQMKQGNMQHALVVKGTR
jgi:hypothetical protein